MKPLDVLGLLDNVADRNITPDEALTLLENAILKYVIGGAEPEEEQCPECGVYSLSENMSRNDLRKEQRTKLKQLMKGQ